MRILTEVVNPVPQPTVAGKLTSRRSLHARVVAKITTTLLVLACAAGFAASASASAEPLQPWWHLTSGARPTYLFHGGQATDEVQEVTVDATTGHFAIGSLESFEQIMPYDATLTEVSNRLTEMFGAGNVEVQEGEHNTTTLRTWKITFIGARADQAVPSLEVKSVHLGAINGLEIEVKPGEFIEGSITSTVLTEGKPDGQIVATVSNLGDAPATEGCAKAPGHTGNYKNSTCTEEAEEPGKGEYEKTPITVTDRLPPGLTPVAAEQEASHGNPSGCQVAKATRTVTCTQSSLAPYQQIEVRVSVLVEGAETGVLNEVAVSGAGVPPASIMRPIEVGAATPFGIEQFELSNVLVGGAPDTQAGSHPFQTTFTVGLNQLAMGSNLGSPEVFPAALAKDLTFKLPPGLVGNPAPFAQCSLSQFFHKPKPTCAAQTVLGVAIITFDEPGRLGLDKATIPVYNLEPQVGEPARFGFLVTNQNPVLVDTAVRSGQDYGIMGITSNITTTAALISSEVTFWGVPGKPEHDLYRGEGCLGNNPEEPCQPLAENNPPPFFELPSACTGEAEVTALGDSWTDPIASGEYPTLASFEEPALHGCNRLPFRPSIEVKADGSAASSPSGLTVDVHNPQQESLNAEGLGEADVKDITVALPPGVAINPATAGGLEACSEGLVGFEAAAGKNGDGFEEFLPGAPMPLFTPYLSGSIAAKAAVADGNVPEREDILQPGLNFCPNAAKIGEAEIVTPLLPANQPVKGFVYLAAENANPFGSLIALYLVAEDEKSGVLIKVAGQVSICQRAGETIAGMTCQAQGQLISTFQNSPQAPFEDARLHFFGGERAPLATPSRCGSYATNASFVPWSAEPGEAPHTATSEFKITEGPNHTPCPGPSLPFSPTVTGGATNVNAGAFSPFTLTLSRRDGEQNMQSVTATLPPGLSGVLSNVELCPEPQADEGKCGSNSLIGESTVSVGVGGDPFSVSGGKFYLTGPYNGASGCAVGTSGCAPFGVTFEVPAKAGPFDLERNSANPAGEDACDCVVVRGKIEIDPYTAAITITSNPPGTPYSIPTSIEGIPLEIQHINAITTRNDFQFNPTNCNKMEVTGTIHSSEGGTDTLGVPFQVTNCAALKFEPKVSIATSGKTSKANGASLTYKVSYPKAPQGTDADIHYVKVELPKALPSRLTTLQKACTQAQFKANPAGCPSASVIGHAKAVVPNIPVPLEGPVYFVSNGGEAFPNLVIVLEGYNVTIDLVGDTFISKSGITSTTFKTVPDNPVYSFEINLPEGKYSALAANGNLCTKKLVMPNEYVAQNGTSYNASLPISVTGCKEMTRSQKLKAALAACRKKDHRKAKREACERQARSRYAPLKKKGKTRK
jgi:hypothetical protein